MKKEQIKREILRILTLDIKDLPRRKRHLYFLAYSVFVFIQYMIFFYMIIFLAREWIYFGFLAIIYLLVLKYSIFIVVRRYRKTGAT